MSPTTKKWLIVIIILLGVVKFAVQPLIEWQNQELTGLTQLRERLAKSVALIESGERTSELAVKATREWQKAEQTFPAPSSVNDLKRILQSEIGALGSDYNVSLDLINWGRTRALDIPKLHEQPVSVTVSGSVTDIAKFHTALLKQYRYVQQQTARLDFRGRMLKSKAGTLKMELSTYFWFEGAIE